MSKQSTTRDLRAQVRILEKEGQKLAKDLEAIYLMILVFERDQRSGKDPCNLT